MEVGVGIGGWGRSSIKVPDKELFFPCGHPYTDALLGLARQSTGFSSLVKLRESCITRTPVGRTIILIFTSLILIEINRRENRLYRETRI